MSFAMPSVDTASQAGIYNSKIIACNALALKEKCAALQEEFIACSEKFSHGRRQIDHAKRVMGSMQTTLTRLNDTLEGLNAMQIDSDAQRNVQIAKLRGDIASREELLHKLKKQALHTNNEHSDRTTKAIRVDEINIAHLQKVDQEIDQTSENLSEVSLKLEKLKELHDKRKLADKDKLLALQLESIDVELQRRHLLSLKHDNVVNLTKLSVTPGECSRLQTEIEELKLRQANMKQSIEQLIDERDLLRDTANEVIKRIHSLEMEVRKKTGDRVFNCFTCLKPTRHNGHCLPSVLQTARPLTIGQIKRLCDIQYPNYSNNHRAEIFDDVPTQDDIHRQIKMKRSTLIIIAFISAVLLPLRFVFAFYAYPSGVNTFAAGGVGDLSGNGMADLIAPLFLLSIFLNLMDSFSDNDGGSVILSGNSNNNNNNGGSSSYINQGTNNYNDGTSNYNAGTSNYNNNDYSGGGGYSTNVSPSTWDGGCASC